MTNPKIEDRLDNLEAQVSRIERSLIHLWASLAPDGEGPALSMRTERIEVVDERGNVRIIIGNIGTELDPHYGIEANGDQPNARLHAGLGQVEAALRVTGGAFGVVEIHHDATWDEAALST